MSSFLYSPAVPEASWRQRGDGFDSNRSSRRPTRNQPSRLLRVDASRNGQAQPGAYTYVDRRERASETPVNDGNDYPEANEPTPRAGRPSAKWAQHSQTMTERQTQHRPQLLAWPRRVSPQPPPPPVIIKGSLLSYLFTEFIIFCYTVKVIKKFSIQKNVIAPPTQCQCGWRKREH